eukprot:1146111-Pelagomonas_calceolata.AAC.6
MTKTHLIWCSGSSGMEIGWSKRRVHRGWLGMCAPTGCFQTLVLLTAKNRLYMESRLKNSPAGARICREHAKEPVFRPQITPSAILSIPFTTLNNWDLTTNMPLNLLANFMLRMPTSLLPLGARLETIILLTARFVSEGTHGSSEPIRLLSFIDVGRFLCICSFYFLFFPPWRLRDKWSSVEAHLIPALQELGKAEEGATASTEEGAAARGVLLGVMGRGAPLAANYP